MEALQSQTDRTGYRPIPTLGYWALAKHLPSLVFDRAEAIRKISLQGEGLIRIPIPGRSMYVISRPEYVKYVLQTHSRNYRRPFDIEILRTFLGDGVLTTHDEPWREGRQVAQPAFHSEAVKALQSQITQLVTAWLDGLPPADDGSVRLNCFRAMSGLSLTISAKILFNFDVSEILDGLLTDIGVCIDEMDHRVSVAVDFSRYFATPSRIRFDRALARINRHLYAFIDRESGREPGTRSHLMEHLFEGSRKVEESRRRRWLRDHVMTFLITGHETVAASLSWTLKLLAEHTEWQARSLEDESVLTAVIQESMRLYPPVWAVGRESIEADQLGEFAVPAKSTLLLCQYATHRNPALWDAPGCFRPERFLEAKRVSPYEFFPFSVGPRYCMGDAFAWLEMKSVARELLARFKIARTENGEVGMAAFISLRPKRDFALSLTRRC